ncbi:MAG: acetyl-CoA carboxylase biotin carboxylase subunit [Thermogemmatispora sp.]|uniref:Biotin carboxylase n=1 Tax=Thermogemmatispora aurantia TaxID=2045279 RepID=A0A5J4K816_9CHLR|nr:MULTISPECIES: acetyl-CoA carboxylase biotin carboxylase subunit [Thermogemmatispora]MBE3567330.1 acetyl-CoA carboxylase biotin carboxylase subunit [Thermogemmatispora sp.]GER82821.1 acetyl-CoA carboxylase biotin carboxylase subunit [Thermogemmatispora aurantia]
MFRKILIANRGEIALRVIRACREMGIRTIIAHSEADRDSLPVRMADEHICIGPGPSGKSYLNIPNIISAALISGAEAIHPGYGFLSENPSFAQICADVNLTFIGPSATAMAIMGDKVSAREAMAAAGLPMLPGTRVLRTLAEAREAAREIGFPLMLKAAAGGGGRGIRLVNSPEEFERVFTLAQNEVREAFRDDGLYLERYLPRARHIEIQVLVDHHGNGVHLGERNCSCQRRNQKVLEESPSPLLPPELRQEIGMKAIRAVQQIGYTNAGTLEFLLDDENRYYFMEMNTRLQVEHPVTEMVTSVDLVKEQIRIAAGEPLQLKQENIQFRGHAIECRITAEDAEADFRPQTGVVEKYLPPGGPGVRVDSHLYAGYSVPPHYDSLLAKLIVWAEDRDAAIARMQRALDEFVIEGLPTTIPFHQRLLRHQVFIRGEAYTRFLQEEAASLGI